ncbi:Lrp/AsnC family transcriptional regulator [Mesorhizobium sp. B1-1-8]|uniref:Lrp/AsnC family transcriptional regulator n=1 Tax=Mesorhizobium sp. B1-1-8 TaxID=2589976 RepID=UPI00112D01CC|nr:Lrp/AsnC family transcriptional regulator [Mesorhizobium sp. B1-1-8]UCI10691.1 Lrp/AsnC family transcriptional regulator [Mesorhizobium sp. B1-1-8]
MLKDGIDHIDRKLLAALQADAHATTESLGEIAGLSPSPCARRVRMLEKSGVIKAYVAVVDQVKVGLPVSAFASVKLERQREEELDRFSSTVSRWPEVVECYLMTGKMDFLLRIVAKDLAAYEAFLKQKLTRLDGVASIETSFALGQVKHALGLPILA